MNMIKSLGTLQPSDQANVGGKAWSNDLILKCSLPGAQGFSVGGEFFKYFVCANSLEFKINKLLREQQVSAKDRIKYWIYNAPFPAELIEPLQAAASALGDRLVVRSSFPYEDRSDFSGAGQFVSFLDVENRLDTLIDRIKKCWLSLFDSLITLESIEEIESLSLAVLVQDFLPFEKLGVAFSRHPFGEQEDVIVVESSTPEHSVVDGGDGSTSVYALQQETLAPVSQTEHPQSSLDATALAWIADGVRRLEPHFPEGVDVEWGLCADGTVRFVQARPITCFAQQKRNILDEQDIAYVSIDDPAVTELDLTPYYLKVVQHHWQKRHWWRLEAEQRGLRYYRVGFLFLKRAQLGSDAYESIMAGFRTPMLYLVFEAKNQPYELMIDKADLAAVIDRYFGQDPDQDVIVRISEFIEPVCCGLASVTEEGLHFLEYIPGDTVGLVKEGVPFSSMLVDAAGNVQEQQIALTASRWAFDRASGRPQLSAWPEPYAYELHAPLIQPIQAITRVMTAKFGQVRIEWMYDGEELFLYDLSLENAPLLLCAGSLQTKVLSPGRASGPAVVITAEDTAALRASIKKRRSVVPSIEELEALQSASALSLRDQIVARTAEKPIIVAPYPDLNLCVLLGDVAGFVFDGGALLSHMGIILREAGIPALFVKGASSDFKTGDQIEIADGQIAHFAV